jgi:protein-S-isoprenylcysteine O-methyltransferase Ste14
VLLFIRHLVAILVLPMTMAVFVPIWIARQNRVTLEAPHGPVGILTVALGAVLLIVGFVLFIASLRRFAVEGRGTLAPWDPPRRLVVRGPYRFVRNPMISGVIFLLFGEAAVLRSRPHAMWAATFLAINLIYIPLLEEPMLEKRFGDEYRQYCRHVRRFIPRLKPWTSGENTDRI